MGESGRRELLGFLGAATLVGAAARADKKDKPAKGDDVGPVEDLMREHGVIRRTLVVYRETARLLRELPGTVSLPALNRAVKLMRTFAEEYHEKKLEEGYLFPKVKKAGGRAAAEVEVLLAQHARGREITDYLLANTAKPLEQLPVKEVSAAMESFARMYELHTAHEDTIVFPAWRASMPARQLEELGDRFEEIETQTLGKDGFEEAVKQIDAVEAELHVDLNAVTAPPPQQ